MTAKRACEECEKLRAERDAAAALVDGLKRQLNQAVYEGDKVRAERDVAEKRAEEVTQHAACLAAANRDFEEGKELTRDEAAREADYKQDLHETIHSMGVEHDRLADALREVEEVTIGTGDPFALIKAVREIVQSVRTDTPAPKECGLPDGWMWDDLDHLVVYATRKGGGQIWVTKDGGVEARGADAQAVLAVLQRAALTPTGKTEVT